MGVNGGDGARQARPAGPAAGRRWIVAAATVLGALVLAGLAAGLPPRREAPAVVVFAAASLQDLFTELGHRFEEAHPGTRVRFNFAGSQILQAQLAQGARADVFAPADRVQLEAAMEQGLLAGPGRIFARSRLVVVVPRENRAGIQAFRDLGRGGIRLVLAHEGVPAGRYGREVLNRAAEDPAFGPGFRERVLAAVVSEESNVRQVVAKVRLGEADAGLVYATDATPAALRELQVIEIPSGLNVTVQYPVALVRGAPNPRGGEAFMAYLFSEEGRALLRSFGFQPAGGEGD